MRFTGAGNMLQFDKDNDKLYPVGMGGGIGQELDSAFFTSGISEDVLWDTDENLTLTGNDALWVWAHGNRHRDCICAGVNEQVTPSVLATRIARRLQQPATGHIIIWSCWGGAPGGFAEHFAAFMRARGFNALRV